MTTRKPRLTLRIDLGEAGAIGPGKVRLLELVGDTGSIRRAAAALEMSYRQAWLLLQALEETFGAPLVETSTGGKKGGGARLTSFAIWVIDAYRSIEAEAQAHVAGKLRALSARAKGKSCTTRRPMRVNRASRASPRQAQNK